MFFLYGNAGKIKTYFLSLRDVVKAQGMFVEICAKTGIAASLYRNGRTLHNLLGIGVEDKDASERHCDVLRLTGVHGDFFGFLWLSPEPNREAWTWSEFIQAIGDRGCYD